MCRAHYQRWLRTGRAERQPRLTHAEVALRAKADAIVLLVAAKAVDRTASPDQLASLVGVSVDDLKAAAARRKGQDADPDPPRATRRRKNRTAPPGVKWCPQCKRLLPLDQFSRNRFTADGRQSWCARCIRERAQAKKAS